MHRIGNLILIKHVGSEITMVIQYPTGSPLVHTGIGTNGDRGSTFAQDEDSWPEEEAGLTLSSTWTSAGLHLEASSINVGA
jgi:hypothetical protein